MAESSVKEKNDIIEQNYIKYSQMVFSRCYAVLQNHSLAEDCMQETFARYSKCYDGLSEDVNVPGWLNRTAVFVSRECLRRDKFESVDGYEDIKEKLELYEDYQDQAGLITSAEMDTECEEDEEFYKSLPPQYQRLYDLRFRMDMKLADVARVMECTEGSVKMRLKRLMKMGKKYFSQKNKNI